MRASTAVALWLLLAGGPPARTALVVEDRTSIVGPDRRTAEALGVETLGGLFTPLIAQGTAVPCSVSETFSTASDGQTQMIVSLFRGNGSLAAENHALGRFQVVGIAKAPAGVPQIEITFAISERSISLSARDLASRSDLKIVKMPDRVPEGVSRRGPSAAGPRAGTGTACLPCPLGTPGRSLASAHPRAFQEASDSHATVGA